MEKRFSIGVDVGGSHISCTTYDLKEGKLVEGTTRSLPMDNKGSKENVLDCFFELINPAINDIDKGSFAGIGMAFPGPIDYDKGIGLFSGNNAKYENLWQVNIRKELSLKLRIDENLIRFINDATAFALGEYFNGTLKGIQNCLAITLGTGFGAAFIENGIPVLCDQRVPKGGCLWHLPFEGGIADEYFSTRGLKERFEKASGRSVTGVKDVADLYATDENAKMVFDDFGEKLAQFLTPWVKSFEIEAMVIGGNISRAFKLFDETLTEAFRKEGITLQIQASALLEDAAFIGAAYLQKDEFFERIKEQLKFM
ncbi:ROK family protein [Saccharicrinis fermentans]|uniref:Glucokinase n=1 Tax=Saccharicrinis fermentans DSM 9555 = JCM 21142 TaxID=869213 RepID=W7Y0U8_9BACT|nr:ROK family protein [Saccharicrinis fermentans]GAF01562.1 glucokinase [Saccharicrinis fermentans DSM 9555 = JCM 21142]